MEDTEALLGGSQPNPKSWIRHTTDRLVKPIPERMRDTSSRFIRPLPTSTRRQLAALAVILLLGLSWLLLMTDTKVFIRGPPPSPDCPVKYIETLPTCKAADGTTAVIPNIVHYVFLLKNPEADFPLQFSHFLSMYGAWRLWRPDTIYLHTNVGPDSPPVRRARSGEAGKWNKLVFGIPGLVVNTVEVPETAGNGVNITMMEHKSDFIRVRMVHQYGGIYTDLDVQPLRSIATLRKSGYQAVGGREFGHRDKQGQDHIGTLNSGTFMSVAGGEMISRWMERMNQVFDQGWITHSNEALTTVAEDLVAKQVTNGGGCDMLVLGREGFAPGSWMSWDVKALFDEHDDASGAAAWPGDDFRQGDPIPPHVDEKPGETPDWATDYSCTYLLHAFSPKKARNGAKNNGITPRYVLRRQSNYARATYPIARDMYNEGLLAINDTDVGT